MRAKLIPAIIIVAILLLGIFLLIQSRNVQKTPRTGVENTVPGGNTSLTTNPSSEVQTKLIELVIRGKKIIGQPNLSVLSGDQVKFKITSDEAGQLRINGIEKYVDLEKDTPVELLVTANLTGRFPIVLVVSGTELGVLEVFPK